MPLFSNILIADHCSSKNLIGMQLSILALSRGNYSVWRLTGVQFKSETKLLIGLGYVLNMQTIASHLNCSQQGYNV